MATDIIQLHIWIMIFHGQAYVKYGVLKGTVLTAWRLLRCNPFGESADLVRTVRRIRLTVNSL